jgi:phenylpropionate dioxygenase-like ring-hydroxylating dioxygenase large terminal subunit
MSEQQNVDANIARAWTLPASVYVDPAALPREFERIFAHTWQPVGRREQVKNPGEYFTTTVAGEPLLVVRGNGGELRAFYNVCRHRAGPPAEGCGTRKVFRCGYHGWTYGLDGGLIAAPRGRISPAGVRPVQTATASLLRQIAQ